VSYITGKKFRDANLNFKATALSYNSVTRIEIISTNNETVFILGGDVFTLYLRNSFI
jgi:hypothetical protein